MHVLGASPLKKKSQNICGTPLLYRSGARRRQTALHLDIFHEVAAGLADQGDVLFTLRLPLHKAAAGTPDNIMLLAGNHVHVPDWRLLKVASDLITGLVLEHCDHILLLVDHERHCRFLSVSVSYTSTPDYTDIG